MSAVDFVRFKLLAMARAAFIVCLLMACAWSSHAVMFKLSPNTQKCLKEDIQANQLVMGEFEVSDVPGQIIDYVVSFPLGTRT